MRTLSQAIDAIDPSDLARLTDAVSNDDVLGVLSRPRHGLSDLPVLLSPRAGDHLEAMARLATTITQTRFGKTIQLYAPLYLSSFCTNSCTYCAFNTTSGIDRRVLTVDEAMAEAGFLHDEGIRSILLLTGEAPGRTPTSYLAEVIRALKPRFPSVAIEVFPMDQAGYAEVVEAGADGVTLYQETYDRAVYGEVHPSGPKRDYDRRLEAPSLAARGGMRRIGLGALLGLADWRFEMMALAVHGAHLIRHAWRSFVTMSFPRMRHAEGGTPPRVVVTDRELVQMIAAMRIVFPDVGLVLSTRESAVLRDHLASIGITIMSAGSHTEPGGYSSPHEADEQFAVLDTRSVDEVRASLVARGLDPVAKDWEGFMTGT